MLTLRLRSSPRPTSKLSIMESVSLDNQDGCVKLSEKMLSWKFMGQVCIGIKSIPKALGPESFTDVPKYPELNPQLIYKIVFIRYPAALRYFPDPKAANFANLYQTFRAAHRRINSSS